tara:strand:+ start:4675 stop:5247 length:573 start_codon:yes stop_codon:yes gene_type:complete
LLINIHDGFLLDIGMWLNDPYRNLILEVSMKSVILIISLMLMVPQAYGLSIIQTMSHGNGIETTVVIMPNGNWNGLVHNYDNKLVYRAEERHRVVVQLIAVHPDDPSQYCAYVTSNGFLNPIVVIDGISYDKESERCKNTKKLMVIQGKEYVSTDYYGISIRGSGFRADRNSTIYVVEGHSSAGINKLFN